MKTIYRVTESEGLQVLQVIAETDYSMIVKYPSGKEWIVYKNEMAAKINDAGKQFYYGKTMALETLKRVMDGLAKRIETFREQLFVV